MIISERTKELVDKFIKQSYKESRGWSMKEVPRKNKKDKKDQLIKKTIYCREVL